jgi:hypothetical protein
VGIGSASLLADRGYEVPTALLSAPRSAVTGRGPVGHAPSRSELFRESRMLSERAGESHGADVTESPASASSLSARRRFLAPLALAQFIPDRAFDTVIARATGLPR